MTKVLFLIHDLGPGGAEKVLLNLVNNIDHNSFDVTVMTLFDVGINRQFLSPKVHYKYAFKKMFRGNSHLMKVLTPSQLHKWLIKERYDIEISYLEGPCARVIAGCQDPNTKKLCWIHREMVNRKFFLQGFRDMKEATLVYNSFDKIVGVSETVKKDFEKQFELNKPMIVLYNTNETEKIHKLADEQVDDLIFSHNEFNLFGVGKLLASKGFDRILRITEQLKGKGYPVHIYILGEGPEETTLKKYIMQNNMEHYATLLGYQTNPYKYLSHADLFVCASYAEGFSTAATEALIIGIPVCTVEVSGMKEMLGEDNEYGIVTSNDDKSLEQGIEYMLQDTVLRHYTEQAKVRGMDFSTNKTVEAVQEVLLDL